MKTGKRSGTIRVLLALVVTAAAVFGFSEDAYAAKRPNTNASETTEDAAASETKTVTEGSADNTAADTAASDSATSNTAKSDTAAESSTKSSKSDSSESHDEYVDTAAKSNDASDTASSESSKKTTTSSGSSKKKSTALVSSSSSSSDGYKELMTDRQRKSKFWSKTNPKTGSTPVTTQRPASAGFSYADFGRYNDYNSKNNLGGTPIYLLGTVMDVQPVKEGDKDYKVAVLVNDCDGYQWYMRVRCDKTKYDLMKNEILGKAGYIYGTYAGYSGVVERPMMDMTVMIETPGNAVNMALYR